LVRESEHYVELEFTNEIPFGHICSTNAYLDERAYQESSSVVKQMTRMV
jgi:hypothetical protein